MIQYINRKSSFPSMMKLKLCVYYDTVVTVMLCLYIGLRMDRVVMW